MTLRVRGLRVRYGETVAVHGIDLDAAGGEVLAVVGPNGSGKSSLLRAVAGVQASEGGIEARGGPVAPGAIGYMAQDTGSRAALTVVEAVLLGRLRRLGLRVAPADLAAAEALLAELGLSGLAGRHLGELSGGQRQMVFLAQALAAEPQVLLLDEPVSALDLRHQIEVLALVRRLTAERGLVTLCVLHDLNAAAAYADRVALVAAGRLVACGPPADVLTPARIAATFGVQCEVESRAGRPLRIAVLGLA